jgi:hypothetical protein
VVREAPLNRTFSESRLDTAKCREAVFRYESESSAHLARYDVCEQDGCDGESGNTHAVSPVPNPMYPLPIGSTFCDATIEWNQE